MDETTSAVLQSDQKRVKQSVGRASPSAAAAARWRKLLEDQRASGLPVSAFCRERGIAASSLFAWRRRLCPPRQPASGGGGGGGETFRPVKLIAHARPGHGEMVGDDAAIELCLRGGRRLMLRTGFDRQLLAEVIAALEALP
jgi:hypothetical protein